MGSLNVLMACSIVGLGCSIAGLGCTASNPGQQSDSGVGEMGALADLAMSGGDQGSKDLTGADLITPPGGDGFGRMDFSGVDFTGFCSGTAVAGTCVQTFFAPLAACFMPAGACHVLSPSVAKTATYCWMDGAVLKSTSMLESSTRTWLSGATVCFNETVTQLAVIGPTFSDGTASLQLNPTTGAYKCANGTTGSIGANLGGCAALDSLINPTTSSCTIGSCPP